MQKKLEFETNKLNALRQRKVLTFIFILFFVSLTIIFGITFAYYSYYNDSLNSSVIAFQNVKVEVNYLKKYQIVNIEFKNKNFTIKHQFNGIKSYTNNFASFFNLMKKHFHYKSNETYFNLQINNVNSIDIVKVNFKNAKITNNNNYIECYKVSTMIINDNQSYACFSFKPNYWYDQTQSNWLANNQTIINPAVLTNLSNSHYWLSLNGLALFIQYEGIVQLISNQICFNSNKIASKLNFETNYSYDVCVGSDARAIHEYILNNKPNLYN